MFPRKNSIVIFFTSLIFILLIGCIGVLSDDSNSNLSIPTKSDKVLISQASNAPISLDIPIKCNLGKDCFILHYVDIDPTEVAVDFGCGRQTYDGHKGTDFGIADLELMAQGIPVVATAPGTVLRIRDGIPDRLVDNQDKKQAVVDRECGNGVVISHGDGWETQYCHLRQGSVAVKPDTKVERGTVLGMVGASGLASFPHVHLSVRHNGAVIDPFVGANRNQECTQNRNPLWSQPLEYNPTGLIDAGFSSQPPAQTQLWQGKNKDESLTTNSPALIFWVQSFGVLAGDVEKWQLTTPDGQTIKQENSLEQPYRSWVSYIGKRQIIPGFWQGEYQLWRNSELLFKVNREVVVKN